MAHWAPSSCAVGIGIFLAALSYNTSGVVASIHLHVFVVLVCSQLSTSFVNGKHMLARWYLQSSSRALSVEPHVLFLSQQAGLPTSLQAGGSP